MKYCYLTASMSLMNVGRSEDATLKTSGSAVQTTALEFQSTTEDKHVLPYFLYSAREKLFNYSDTRGYYIRENLPK
jgi:hypothetical protein